MKYLLYLIITFAIVSCNSYNRLTEVEEIGIHYSHQDTLNIDNWYGNVMDKNMPLSELMDTVVLVPLETNANSLISQVTKVHFSKDKIFVFDNRQEVVFIFSDMGKYLQKVDKKGKGPKEYFQMNDFTITDNNEIVIISFGRKIIAYDFNGEYLWHRIIDIKSATEIEYAGDDNYYISCLYRGATTIGKDMQYNLIKYNKDKGIIAKYFPYNNTFGEQHQFTKNEYFGSGLDKNLFFTKFYDENIYLLTNDSITAFRNINIDGLSIDKEKVFNIVELSVEFEKNPLLAYLCNYHSTKRYDFFSYRVSNSKINVYLNNQNNNRYFTLSQEWKKEANFYTYILGFHSPHCSKNDFFVTSFYPRDWFDTKRIMADYFHEVGENIEEMFPNKGIHENLSLLNNDSNPVLVFYKIK